MPRALLMCSAHGWACLGGCAVLCCAVLTRVQGTAEVHAQSGRQTRACVVLDGERWYGTRSASDRTDDGTRGCVATSCLLLRPPLARAELAKDPDRSELTLAVFCMSSEQAGRICAKLAVGKAETRHPRCASQQWRQSCRQWLMASAVDDADPSCENFYPSSSSSLSEELNKTLNKRLIFLFCVHKPLPAKPASPDRSPGRRWRAAAAAASPVTAGCWPVLPRGCGAAHRPGLLRLPVKRLRHRSARRLGCGWVSRSLHVEHS